jgi:exonuclease SbcC
MKDLYLATWSCRNKGVSGKILKKPDVKRNLFKYNNQTQDWEVLEQNAEDVLQLSYEQFTRSVILNQGEFARFLTSSFPERRQILERLYSGENLQSLKTLLNDKLKTTESEKEMLDQKGQGLMPFSEEHFKELQQQRKELIKKDSDALEALTLSKKLLTEFDRFWDVLQQHQNTHIKLSSLSQQFEEQTENVNISKREKQAIEEHMSSTTQDYKKLRPILERIQQIVQSYQQTEENYTDRSQRKKNLDLAKEQKINQFSKNQEQIQTYQNDIKGLKAKLPENIQAKTNEQKELIENDLSVFLKNAPELKNIYKTLEQSVRHAQRELELKYNENKNTQQKIEATNSKVEELKSEHKKNLSPYKSIEEIEEQKQSLILHLRDLETKMQQIEETTEQLKAASAEVNTLEKTIASSIEKLSDYDEKISQIEEWKKLNELQASLENCIKQSLDEGQCFVCGSEVGESILEHPLLKNNYSPDLSKLEKLKAHRVEIQDEKNKEELKLEVLQTQIDQYKKQQKEWKIQSKEGPAEELTSKKTKLDQKIIDIQKLKQEIDQENVKIEYAKESLLRNQKEVSKRDLEIQKLKEELKITHAKMQKEKESIKHLELPQNFTIEDYGEVSSTLKEIRNQEHNKSQLEDYLKQTQEDLKEIEENTRREDEHLDKLSLSLNKYLTEYKEEQAKAYLEELKDGKSPSSSSAKNMLIELEKNLEKLQAKLNESNQSLQNIELQRNQTRGQISLQKERVKDLSELFTLHKTSFIDILKKLKETGRTLEMKQNWENKFQGLKIEQVTQEQRDALRAFYDDKLHVFFEQTEKDSTYIKESLQEIKAQTDLYQSKQGQKEEILKQAQQIEKKLDGLQKLYSLIGKDEFRNFALAMIERDLIKQTNLELEKICQGRYRIDFSITAKAQEFSLIDYWQGAQQRKISTLSGGETFLVSLAMALSLAEMSRGETEINSFFIDEGFGSLDQDSLEEVIETLSHIRARGKQIGIISHVKELTQRIDVNIDLIKNQHGESHIQVLHN